jgi:hypothetical protein
MNNLMMQIMAVGILSGLEGKLNTRGWRSWWFTPAEQRLVRVLVEDTGEADEDGLNDTCAIFFTEQLEI